MDEDSKWREIAEADTKRSPSAIAAHEAILLEGREELQRASSTIAWSALAAGLSMGFSLVATIRRTSLELRRFRGHPKIWGESHDARKNA